MLINFHAYFRLISDKKTQENCMQMLCTMRRFLLWEVGLTKGSLGMLLNKHMKNLECCVSKLNKRPKGGQSNFNSSEGWVLERYRKCNLISLYVLYMSIGIRKGSNVGVIFTIGIRWNYDTPRPRCPRITCLWASSNQSKLLYTVKYYRIILHPLHVIYQHGQFCLTTQLPTSGMIFFITFLTHFYINARTQ